VIEIEKATGMQFFGDIQAENPIEGVNMRTSLNNFGDFANWINDCPAEQPTTTPPTTTTSSAIELAFSAILTILVLFG